MRVSSLSLVILCLFSLTSALAAHMWHLQDIPITPTVHVNLDYNRCLNPLGGVLYRTASLLNDGAVLIVDQTPRHLVRMNDSLRSQICFGDITLTIDRSGVQTTARSLNDVALFPNMQFLSSPDGKIFFDYATVDKSGYLVRSGCHMLDGSGSDAILDPHPCDMQSIYSATGRTVIYICLKFQRSFCTSLPVHPIVALTDDGKLYYTDRNSVYLNDHGSIHKLTIDYEKTYPQGFFRIRKGG
jgi:hypothetical protein